MTLVNALLFYIFIALLLILNIFFPTLTVAFFVYEALIFLAFLLYMIEKKKFKWGRKGIGFAALLAFALITAIFGIEVSFRLIAVQHLEPDFYVLLILPLVFQIFVSIGEEISFRGYILPGIADDIGVKSGIVASSLMFSVIHIPSMLISDISTVNGVFMFMTLTLGGVVMAMLYLKYGLASSISFHFVWNFMQYHVYSMGGYFVEIKQILEVNYTSIPILTGGVCRDWYCGPEASILGVAMMVVGVVVVFIVTRRKKHESTETTGLHQSDTENK